MLIAQGQLWYNELRVLVKEYMYEYQALNILKTRLHFKLSVGIFK